MKSILQDKKYCFICGATQPLHMHHIMNGPSRKKSEEDGLKVYLCTFCHDQVHTYQEKDEWLKKLAERKYIELHSYEKYMKRYRKNYLDDNELDELVFNEIERGKNAN